MSRTMELSGTSLGVVATIDAGVSSLAGRDRVPDAGDLVSELRPADLLDEVRIHLADELPSLRIDWCQRQRDERGQASECDEEQRSSDVNEWASRKCGRTRGEEHRIERPAVVPTRPPPDEEHHRHDVHPAEHTIAALAKEDVQPEQPERDRDEVGGDRQLLDEEACRAPDAHVADVYGL